MTSNLCKKICRVAIVILLPAFVSGCAKDLVTGKTTLNYYSIDSDIKLGRYVMAMQLKELSKTKKSYDTKNNKAQLEQIREIVGDIAKVSHYPNFPYESHLADVDIVNAWCAPGGKIMVYEGLWDPKNGLVTKGNKDELAAVLAHEIAHATARHVTESISTNLTIYSIGSVATQAISAGTAQGGNIFGEIFSQGFNIFVPSYSRKNEYEADRLGLFYMAKAGYNPQAAVRLWARAAKQKKDKTSIYASHPASGARANELKKWLPEAMKYYEEALLFKNDKKDAKKPKKRRLIEKT